MIAPRLARHAAAPHPEDRAPSWRRNPRRAASCDGLTWLHNAQPPVRLRNRPPVRAGPLPGRTGRRRGHGRPRHARRPIWCERGDSNPHALQRQDLNLLRLPIPPPSRGRHSSAPRCRDGIAWRCHRTATKVRIWIARWLPFRTCAPNTRTPTFLTACRRVVEDGRPAQDSHCTGAGKRRRLDTRTVATPRIASAHINAQTKTPTLITERRRFVEDGGPSRIRTLDLLIKSQLLYQLS